MVLQQTNSGLVIRLATILTRRGRSRRRVEGSCRHELHLTAHRAKYCAVEGQEPNLRICTRMNVTGVLGIDSHLGYQLTGRGNYPSHRIAGLDDLPDGFRG